jgi:hydroxymethylglutaryl-CoA lyase
MANPTAVKTLLDLIIPEAGETPIALHLHDTHGLGLANMEAAMERGVTHFDTSLSGLGGCPFVPGAAGNISTEETARMLAKMHITTDVKIDDIAHCSKRLRAYLALQNKELTSPSKHTIK